MKFFTQIRQRFKAETPKFFRIWMKFWGSLFVVNGALLSAYQLQPDLLPSQPVEWLKWLNFALVIAGAVGWIQSKQAVDFDKTRPETIPDVPKPAGYAPPGPSEAPGPGTPSVLVFLILVLFTACSPSQWLAKLLRKHPDLLTRVDSIRVRDSVIVSVPKVDMDTTFNPLSPDTIYVRDTVTKTVTKYKYNPVTKTAFIHTTSPPKRIPVYYDRMTVITKTYTITDKWWLLRQWWFWLLLLIYGGTVFYLTVQNQPRGLK
jgi:hypothetical protein